MIDNNKGDTIARLAPLFIGRNFKNTLQRINNSQISRSVEKTPETQNKTMLDAITLAKPQISQKPPKFLELKLSLRNGYSKSSSIHKQDQRKNNTDCGCTGEAMVLLTDQSQTNTGEKINSLNHDALRAIVTPLRLNTNSHKRRENPIWKALNDSKTGNILDTTTPITPSTQSSDQSRAQNQKTISSQCEAEKNSLQQYSPPLIQVPAQPRGSRSFRMNQRYSKTREKFSKEKSIDKCGESVKKVLPSDRELATPTQPTINTIVNNDTLATEPNDNQPTIDPLSAAELKPPRSKKRQVPKVTAKSWVLYDGETREYVTGKHPDEIREIASLTKIMTCLLCLKLSRQFSIDLHGTIIPISVIAASMIGTSAELRGGDELLLWDLLHGLMLPSGNDAAFALAEYFGKLLFYQSEEYREKVQGQENSKEKNSQQEVSWKTAVKYFVREMNKYAKEIGLKDSFFANSHGLVHKHNRSTARDVGLLCCEAMTSELFRDIVRTKEYSAKVTNKQNGELSMRIMCWENTNKLLWKGFDGLKTGITSTAGPCLASSLKKDEKNVICVVLGCKTLEHRFTESVRLANYGIYRLLNPKKPAKLIDA